MLFADIAAARDVCSAPQPQSEPSVGSDAAGLFTKQRQKLKGLPLNKKKDSPGSFLLPVCCRIYTIEANYGCHSLSCDQQGEGVCGGKIAVLTVDNFPIQW